MLRRVPFRGRCPDSDVRSLRSLFDRAFRIAAEPWPQVRVKVCADREIRPISRTSRRFCDRPSDETAPDLYCKYLVVKELSGRLRFLTLRESRRDIWCLPGQIVSKVLADSSAVSVESRHRFSRLCSDPLNRVRP